MYYMICIPVVFIAQSQYTEWAFSDDVSELLLDEFDKDVQRSFEELCKVNKWKVAPQVCLGLMVIVLVAVVVRAVMLGPSAVMATVRTRTTQEAV